MRSRERCSPYIIVPLDRALADIIAATTSNDPHVILVAMQVWNNEHLMVAPACDSKECGEGREGAEGVGDIRGGGRSR